MKRRWVKDYCPFARDQGMDSIIGDVAAGETVFGFQFLHPGGPGALVNLKISTNGKVTQMQDAFYKVFVTKSATAVYPPGIPAVVNKPYAYEQYADHFQLYGDTGEWYDVVVIGKVLY